jgi:hypothetical protein
MGAVSLTLHDGRKIGIPANAAFLILNLEKHPDPSKPKAKAQIVFAVQVGRTVQVRDSFKHVLSSFPLSFGNNGWSHLTDVDGRDIVISGPSVIAYEQQKGGIIDVTFELPTGPMTLAIKTTLAEVEGLLKPDPPKPDAPAAPAAPKAPSPAKKPAAKKAAPKSGANDAK